MARPELLSNLGTKRHLETSETVGDTFEVLVGQHIWMAHKMPASGIVYLEMQFVHEDDGRFWVPMHSMAQSDGITKDSVTSISMSVDLLSGLYRITASAAGAESWIGRLGTPFP